ncbi:MAG: dnaX [Candidatus Saccharibacteria bacterium]|nr:dnaX [Candidatus Saccharibacteria bacterium]
MSQALYRKYRSKSLADVVGQDHITDILSRALKSDRIAHAYLLTGPRGVGKTSIARILAHEINGLPYSDDSTHLDIIEIDAASNNGVEDVRDLREKVQIAPTSAAKKVYIIDEVHMLSKPAFNALLKTLEEPPAHVVFILATTDVEKLPATIVSRTQRFGFRAISPVDAVKHLKFIATEENIKVDDAALQLIAERGDGSFRDSISLLDQLSSLADEKQGITVELIETSLGLAPIKIVNDLLISVEKHYVTAIAQLLDQTANSGISATTVTDQLIHILRVGAVEKPQLLPLLDALLDVSKSSQPAMKLLSVLGSFAIQTKPPKTAALASPVLEITATIEELANQATKKHPHIEERKPVAKSSDADSTVSKPLQPDSESAPVPDLTASAKPFTSSTVSSDTFDWDALIQHARTNYVALFSVLSKCSYELLEDELTLFTVNAFYKKKLDDPKYSSHLYDCLKAIGGFQLSIHTIPTRAPLKDVQAASIADIMGGGIEVSLS